MRIDDRTKRNDCTILYGIRVELESSIVDGKREDKRVTDSRTKARTGRGARGTLTGRNCRIPFVEASRNAAKLDSKLVRALFLTRREMIRHPC